MLRPTVTRIPQRASVDVRVILLVLGLRVAIQILMTDFIVSVDLQKKFVAIHAQRSPRQGRSLRSHFTSVTDKSSTAVLIAQCRELVLQQHFQQMSLI
ncbi:hypothetical protein M422DRAFT_276475 [Sphaerobolus stellatus SS14]|uniref:Uncharacterized protein n=1 Tax=Sphaerobolus stellatus (strain SS14) TaxID=990650 RepID=A0A0C9U1W8_SPHS4|nr:hypothetical protein M422DRAFT_276475 [Sphaerobolus stellatus SS14]